MNTEVKNHEAERPAVSGMNKHDTTGKSSRERKQEQWEFHREEIHKLYMMENKTLRKTMQILRDKYNFTPRSALHLILSFVFCSTLGFLKYASQSLLQVYRY